MGNITTGHILTYEILGTAMLVLLGCGVVANIALGKTKGNAGGTLMVNFGWGLGVFAGIYVAFPTGAHLNPAVTLATLMDGRITFGQALAYWAAEMIGAILGAVVCWMAYKQHFDDEPDPATKLGVFSTGPAIRSVGWNLTTEVIATFVLVFPILVSGGTPVDLGPLFVALLVVGIGASLGGPTGYAINPARDLGPRIAHFFLPIKGKGSSDWGYSWIPVIGPLAGATIAWLIYRAIDAESLINTIRDTLSS